MDPHEPNPKRDRNPMQFSVLLVDDNRANRIAIEAELAPLGLELTTVSSAQTALRLLLTQDFSLLILDVSMPGMDGFELAALVREREHNRCTPILFLTNRKTPEDIVKGYLVGAADYLEKPVDALVLQSKVRRYLELYREVAQAPDLLRPAVLLVDDNPHNLRAMEGALGSLGAELVNADSGEGALDRLAEREFALIFLDVRLPGIDGFEVAQQLRGLPLNRETPIIFMTALARMHESVQRGYEMGAVDYLICPAEPDIIRAKTRVFLELFEKRTRMRLQDGFLRRLEQVEAEKHLLEEQFKTRAVESGRELASQKAEAASALAQSRAELVLKLEDLNRQLQSSNQELEAFSYSISHDLRAPLRHTVGFLDLLVAHLGTSLDAPGRDYLSRAVASIRRMDRLISDLLSFSRVSHQAMMITRVDLNELVRAVITDLQVEVGSRAVAWQVGALPAILGDPTLLRAVFQNLLGNALKFTGKCAEARIVVEAWAGPTAEVGVCIRDNGAGFDPAHLDRLFGIFQRLHREEDFPGTGIGLANVRRIVTRHGGRVWAEGKLGEGASFYLAFPNPTLTNP